MVVVFILFLSYIVTIIQDTKPSDLNYHFRSKTKSNSYIFVVRRESHEPKRPPKLVPLSANADLEGLKKKPFKM